MHKVVTISLGGNAYQLEEKAQEALQKYLNKARAKLADDPDKDEVLADFERAIAEKCDGYLSARKTVVSETEIQKIIAEMGPVEAADSPEKTEKDSEGDSQPKRLYTLREGSIIGGVCNGLAAYFNIDVTIVRLIFVLLMFVSAGFWILIYLIAMLVIPEARTPEQRAELRGQKFSAQDVLHRAKQKYADVSSSEHWQEVRKRTEPALSNAGEFVLIILKAVAAALAIFLIVGVGLATAIWLGTLWWLGFSHPHFLDQLSTISPWTVAAGVTAVYLLTALPVLVVSYIFGRASSPKLQTRPVGRWVAIAGVLWVAAWAVLLGVTFATYGRVRDFQATHGYVNVDGQHSICVNDTLCNTSGRSQVPYHY